MSVRYLMPLLALTVTVASGCGPPDGSSDGTWVGRITTEGEVTTVVNESGAVWDGAATLVEEVSIGVESGADEYMFGSITSLYATDERIYVVDPQVPVLRVYNAAGTYLHDLGGEGQGPGEYASPSIVAADASGRAFLYDSQLERINVYGAHGEILDPWHVTDARCCVWPMLPLLGEALWMPVQQWLDDRSDRRYGVQAVGPEGPYGEVIWIPDTGFERSAFPVRPGYSSPTPFTAYEIWNPVPGGGLISGTSDRYRFRIDRGDGTRLVVERYWEPVPIAAEYREWERRQAVAERRRFEGPDFDWDGAEMPDHKPAYRALIPSMTGEIWVMRPGAGVRHEDCAEDPLEDGWEASRERPCWQDDLIVDVFGADGRYLGEVDLPDEVRGRTPAFVVDGSLVVTVAEDANGTIRVKRFRLVTPDAAGQAP